MAISLTYTHLLFIMEFAYYRIIKAKPFYDFVLHRSLIKFLVFKGREYVFLSLINPSCINGFFLLV